MLASEAWQTGTDIAGHLVHTGRSVLTLGVLALREGRGSKFGNIHIGPAGPSQLKLEKYQTLGPFLIDVDLADSALVASLTVTLVVTHQVLAVASVDAGIWRVQNMEYRL